MLKSTILDKQSFKLFNVQKAIRHSTMSSGWIIYLIILLRSYLVLNETNGSSREPISFEIWKSMKREMYCKTTKKLDLFHYYLRYIIQKPFIHFITNK